jgi:hypothetical protein
VRALREWVVKPYKIIEHELRRYQDGGGVTHWVDWDDDSRAWYRVCDVASEVPGKRNADHDSRVDYVTCVRCLGRMRAFYGDEPLE